MLASASLARREQLTIQRNPLATLFRIFNLTTTGSVSISGLTIAYGSGGPIIAGVPFRTQVAEHLRFLKCTLRNDPAGGGGAVANPSTGTVVINNGTLNDNSALFSRGAIDNSSGISNVHGTVNVSRCVIRRNLATRSGGGVRNTGIFNLIDTTLADNRVAGTDNNAAFGAGILKRDAGPHQVHHFG